MRPTKLQILCFDQIEYNAQYLWISIDKIIIKMKYFERTIGYYKVEVVLSKEWLSFKLFNPDEEYFLTGKIDNEELYLSHQLCTAEKVFHYIQRTNTSAIQITQSSLEVKLRNLSNKLSVGFVKVPIRYRYKPCDSLSEVESRIRQIKEDICDLYTGSYALSGSLLQEFLIEMLSRDCEMFMQQRKELLKNTTNCNKMDEEDDTNGDSTLPQIHPRQVSNFFIIPPPSSFIIKPPILCRQSISKQKLEENSKDFFKYNQIEFGFDVDLDNIFLDSIVLSGNKIIKKTSEQAVMAYSSNYIPFLGQYSIKIKINHIMDGQMGMGIISKLLKVQQSIVNHKGAVILNLDGSSIIIDGKETKLSLVPFQEGNIIEIRVNVSAGAIRFYRNGRDKPFLQASIPQQMLRFELFPFVQMVNQGDSITLLI